MTSCPSNEMFTGLLADALGAAERDAVARHVEGCASCQEQLARLTGTPDAELWRCAEQVPPGSSVEEGLIRRLKQMPSGLTLDIRMPAVRLASPSPHAGCQSPAAVGPQWPAVPGYEIL